MMTAALIMVREGFEAALVVAIVSAYLRRIERLDPQLNAFRIVYAERALAEAEQADERGGGTLVQREFEDWIARAAAADPWLREHPPTFEWLNNWPPMSTPWEHPLVRAMVSGQEAASGRPVAAPSPGTPVNFGAASDGSFLEDEGIPSVVYGPGDLKLAHCKDESVELAEIPAAARALAACDTYPRSAHP